MTLKIETYLIERIADASNAAMWWNKNKAILAPVVQELENLGFDAMVSGKQIDFSGTGDKPMLVAAFKVLRSYGFEPGSRPGEKDTTYATYWSAGEYRIWFYFCSTVCKRVQVGTEMKEVPVYEVQCGEPMTITTEEVA